MQTIRRHKTLAALFCAVALATIGVVWAGNEKETYSTTRAAPALIRGGVISSADSLDWSQPITTSGSGLTVFPTRGNPTVGVSARYSVDGASSAISVGLFHKTGGDVYTFMGIADVQTCTGAPGALYVDTNSEYPAGVKFYDTAGATHYEVRTTDPSVSATVRIFAWSYGADTKAAAE